MNKEYPNKQLNRFIPLLSFFLLTMVLISCDFRSLKDPIVLTDVEDEFFLDMWEEITPEGRSFHLLIETIAPQPCRNSPITYRLEQRNNEINISLRDIGTPEDCVPGEAPARARVQLGDLPIGFYRLQIDLRDAIFNEVNLNVFSTVYRINPQTEYGIKPLRTELRRITSDQFWGYLSYPDELQPAVDSFLHTLEDYGSYELPMNGYYGYFTVANGQLAIKDQPQHQALSTWIMSVQGEDRNMLRTHIEQLRKTYGHRGLTVQFRDGQGTVY